MPAKISLKTKETLAYPVGFAAVAAPGTMFLMSSEAQIAKWKPATLIAGEFATGEAIRSGFLKLYARGKSDEYN
ncbi:hypothetical protein [Pseudomonas sp.]|uniref:hypothetical protein n=1 Tax=Pseudomonas sp. TaxID=306 RepID=UPI0025809371|nr:hypothetical protein [Pseudomonas sp.]